MMRADEIDPGVLKKILTLCKGRSDDIKIKMWLICLLKGLGSVSDAIRYGQISARRKQETEEWMKTENKINTA